MIRVIPFHFDIQNDTSHMCWPWPKEELLWFGGKKIKGEGHIPTSIFLPFLHDNSISSFHNSIFIIRKRECLVDNIFVVCAGKVFQQIIGIAMGTDCAPIVADIYQLGIIYNIGDILQIWRSSLNRENYNALIVSYSGNYLLNPDPGHYSTLGHDTGRYSTVESYIYVRLWPSVFLMRGRVCSYHGLIYSLPFSVNG